MKNKTKEKLLNNPFFLNAPYCVFFLDINAGIIANNVVVSNVFEFPSSSKLKFFQLFEEEEFIKQTIDNIKQTKYSILQVKTKIIYSKSNYCNTYQIEMHYYNDEILNEEYIIVFLRSYAELNQLIDILDIHTNYFYTLINLISDPIFLKDIDKKYIIINKGFENLFGISKEEILNKTDYDVFTENEAVDYTKSDQYVLSQNQIVSDTHWKRFKNKKSNFENILLCFNTVKSPIISDTGKTIGLIGISKDITANQLKLIEQKGNVSLIKSLEEAMYNLIESRDIVNSTKKSFELISKSINLISIGYYIKDFEKKNNFNLFSSLNTKNKEYLIKWKKKVNSKYFDNDFKRKLEKDKFVLIKRDLLKFYDTFFDNISLDYDSKIEVLVFPVLYNKKLKSMLCILVKKGEIPDFISGNIDKFSNLFDLTLFQKKSLSIFSYFLMDLIEKKNEENILKEFSYNLELIQQTVDIAFWTDNIYTKDIKYSNYLSKLIPLPKKKNLKRDDLFIFLDKTTIRKINRFYNRLFLMGQAKLILPLLTYNSRKTVLSFNGKIIEDKAIIVVLDITNQKTLEDKLNKNLIEIEKAKKIAEDANEAKSNFLAFLSHELRNMMSVIFGISSILIEKLKNSENEKYAISINKTCNQIIELINNILDFSKLEKNKMTLNPSKFSLRDFSDKLEDNYYLLAKEKNLKFISIVYDNLDDIVFLDEIRIRQIITNLISNAIKFTEKGYIKISISQLEGTNGKNFLVFQVTDTGIGISETELKRIFKPFSQGSDEIYIKYGGTGLGLSIIKQLVLSMNGEIAVKSIKGKGSTFTVKIPQITLKDKENVNVNISKLNEIEDKDFFCFFENTQLIKNKFQDKTIYISIKDTLLKEKLISFLTFYAIKSIELDIDCSIEDNKDNYNNNNIHGKNQDIAIGLIIDDFNKLDSMDKHMTNLPKILINPIEKLSEKNTIYLFEPLTYKNLIESLKNLILLTP